MDALKTKGDILRKGKNPRREILVGTVWGCQRERGSGSGQHPGKRGGNFIKTLTRNYDRGGQ